MLTPSGAVQSQTHGAALPGQQATPTPQIRTPQASRALPGTGQVIQGSFRGGRPQMPMQAVQRAKAPEGQDRVLGMPHRSAVQPSAHGPTVFALPALPSSGPGQSLPAEVQAKMERFFGTSFAHVRIHVVPQAPSIGALAYTQGSHIYFAPGQYNPLSHAGQQLLGHELTHVVQQRAGRVRNPLGSGVAVVQDPHLEAEADLIGRRVAAQPMPVQAKRPGSALSARVAQRRGDSAEKAGVYNS